MSWQATEAVMLTSRASGSARLVLMVLATFADEQGEAWPSAETVAVRAALGERQTRTLLQGLVKMGELVITRPGGGRQTTTRYLLPHLARLETLQSGVNTLQAPAPFRTPRANEFGANTLQSGVNTLQSGVERVQSPAPDPLEPSVEPLVGREGQPESTDQPTGAMPRTDEAHETAIPVIPPSSENPSRPAGEATDQLPVTAGQAHKEVREKSHEPTPPDARMFFGLLCGGYFVSRQRLNVERWFAQYTPEFLQLAWQLAPTVEGGKAQYVFVDWLDRSPSRIWPPALVAQHARDVAIVPAPAQRPNEGETWTCRAGTGPVVEVNPRAQVATIQWGPEPGDVIELPWAAMQPARSA